jgi:23S rRNA (pseudouridine1915-N3)-methyltransferase
MSQLIRVVTVGRTRRGPYLTLEEDYLVRIARLAQPRREMAPASSERRPADRRRAESRSLLALVNPRHVNIAVDITGQIVDSEQFQDLLVRWRNRGDVTFVLGGPDGLDEAVLDACGDRLALSSLTFPHELALVVLLEQIYRALAANENHPYAGH